MIKHQLITFVAIITFNFLLLVGEDYSSGPYTVVPAGMTDISFSINITNDDILERNEIYASY